MDDIPRRRIVTEEVERPVVREGEPAVAETDTPRGVYASRTVPLAEYRAIRFIWFAAGLIDTLVGLRFVLKLFAASPLSSFVALLYAITNPLVAPFRNIFPVSGTSGFVFEPASLVALVIYPLIALALVSLIRIMASRGTTRA
jgi:uncharacterized protein YggT (Ycf19 family)